LCIFEIGSYKSFAWAGFELQSSSFQLFIFFFLWCWDLNSGSTPWATLPALFCDRSFRDRVSWTVCLGWLRTTILLIPASWIARIVGMSHWRLAVHLFWCRFFLCSPDWPQKNWFFFWFFLGFCFFFFWLYWGLNWRSYTY
jgi:hypothetical protein